MKEKIALNQQRSIEVINLQSSNEEPGQELSAKQNHRSVENHLSSDIDSSDQSSSSQSDSNFAFSNLMPVNGKKKSKLNLGLTSFFGQSNKSVKTRQNQEKTNIEFEDNDEQKNEHEESLSIPSPDEFSSNQEEINNCQPKKKPKLMAQLEQELVRPTQELTIKQNMQKRAQRKRENKKRDYHIKKKYRELKKGKKKDGISNQVFNAIEEYFM